MVADLVKNFWTADCLHVCLLLLDGQVSESPDPEGAINTVCDFTSYMPCPGHSCPSLDNFAAQREDWLARRTSYTSCPSVWDGLTFTPWKTEADNLVNFSLKLYKISESFMFNVAGKSNGSFKIL